MIRTLYQPFKELMMHPDFHWSEAEQRFHASADAWGKQIEVRAVSPQCLDAARVLSARFRSLARSPGQPLCGPLQVALVPALH
jgi:hypothetical protein